MNHQPSNGYVFLKEIVTHILERQLAGCSGLGWPSWDFTNGVLDCKDLIPNQLLWFHWGDLLVVPREKRYNGLKAGDCYKLAGWEADPQSGKITLVTGEKMGGDDE